MPYSIIMHINYCEQGQTIGETCRKAAGWGFDGVEFRRKRMGIDETQSSYLTEIEDGVRAAGLKKVLFGYPGPLVLNPDKAARQDEVDGAVAFYREVADRFGVTTINLLTGQLHNPDKSVPYFDYTKHGSFIVSDDQWRWQVEGCREMADRLADVDIKFGFETHPVYIHDTLESTLRLVREIDRPSIGVNLDYGNMVGFDEHPSLETAVESVKDHLHYVHLKNSAPLRGAPGRLATSLAEGEINNRQFIRLLTKIGYSGPICIEAPRGGDREWFAAADLSYLRSILSDIEGR
jgi:sugar phosphate isomerase/epimerase